jgi:hypothetical protein
VSFILSTHLIFYKLLFLTALQMQGSRWSEMHDALIRIAEYALQHIVEVDVSFFNSPHIIRGMEVGQELPTLMSDLTFQQGTEQLDTVFSQVEPTG